MDGFLAPHLGAPGGRARSGGHGREERGLLTFAQAKERLEHFSAEDSKAKAESSIRRGSAPGLTAHDVTVTEGRTLNIDTSNGLSQHSRMLPACESCLSSQFTCRPGSRFPTPPETCPPRSCPDAPAA